ncbi:MAG TPA: cell envelope integrity protein TolA [Opitutaceae bacterium]|nr:cell envelope integrity protein TolA [Opitutaceae bacterium]
MTARSPGAFMLSASFHAAVIALVFFMAMMAGQQEKPKPHIMELVAGEGDNYGATVAPKLGTPGGVKLNVPAAPAKPKTPEPAPVQIEQPEPAAVTPPPTPVAPAPKPKAVAPPKPAPKSSLTMRQKLIRKLWAADAKARRDIAKRHAEEERMRKEEFDRLQRERKAALARANGSPKIAHIDADGIAKGVLGGSSANKVGGAGGKALSREDGPVLDAYFALLKQRVLNAIDKPPGVSDELSVTVRVHIWPDGRLTGARVIKSSGSDDFDRAVIAAFGHVEMPEHPEHKGEDLELVFRTKDAGAG